MIYSRPDGPEDTVMHPSAAPLAEDGISNPVYRYHPEPQLDRMNEDLREELVRLLPRLRRFAYSLCRDNDKCNDLVQETCARALTKLELWQQGTRFDSWLFRMAQNIWLDRMRAERARGEPVQIDDAYDVVDIDGRDVTDSRMTLDAVSRGMATLAVEQQVVVALVCVDGMSYKEAAAVLGLPIGTVMSRLSRARLALHEVVFGDTTGDNGNGSEWHRGRVVR